MGLLEGIRRGGNERRLLEQLRQERNQSQFLAESMRSLEDQISDEGWRRLTTRMDREFTRGGLDELQRISRAMYLSHPLIQRAVNVRAYYTWAQGMSYRADDKITAEVVDPLVDEPRNRVELFGHQARLLTDVDQQCDGNTFIALFTNDDGDIKTRSVPAEEIREIHTSPDDRREVWFYRRCWNEERFDVGTGITVVRQQERLYPDIRHPDLRGPRSPVQSIGGIDVQWDAPIIHLRTGGLKAWQFGAPETYAALDWARAYRDFLQDWHTIVSSLARFAWRMTTKGSKVKTARDRLASTVTADEPLETNRAPVPGSVFVGTGDQDLAPIPKTGANTSAEDARPSRLMVGAAMDLPDTILSGDADQGTLATAKTLDRPTELAMRSRQSMWAEHDREIFDYAVWARYRRTNGGPAGVDDLSVVASFPPILEHDMTGMVTAIVSAATLDGKVEAGTIPREQLVRMLLEALNVEDVQDVIEQLKPGAKESLAAAVHALAASATSS